jgi:hypothetical protein
MLFEKHVGLPPAGSLREALLRTVWLRRQEIEANKVKVLAQGMSDQLVGNNKATIEAYQHFLESAFPFLEKHRKLSDDEMVKRLQEEVQKGPLHFSPVVMKPLRDHVSRVSETRKRS